MFRSFVPYSYRTFHAMYFSCTGARGARLHTE